MKVTWHKFREQQPKDLSLIWICRDGQVGNSVIRYVFGSNLLDNDYTYWAYAELPEPPEEEKHYCRSIDEQGVMWVCKDSAIEGLFTLCKKKNGLVEVDVVFCPFCGEEARCSEEQTNSEQEQDDE